MILVYAYYQILTNTC